MTRTFITGVAVVLLALCAFTSGSSQEVGTDDYKSLEGGKWNDPAYVVNAGRFTLSFDFTLAIDKIADGKVMGSITSKEKSEREPKSMQFSSDINKTPDGKLSFVVKIAWSGSKCRFDLQEDGSFAMNSSGASGASGVLKRVTN